MSEQDGEQFIIEELQSGGAQEVYDWRVRYLIKWELTRYNLGRFRCAGDSTWQLLHWGAMLAIADIKNYDGAERLSKFIGCEVQYSTEFIRKLDWVKIDREGSIRTPNPDS